LLTSWLRTPKVPFKSRPEQRIDELASILDFTNVRIFEMAKHIGAKISFKFLSFYAIFTQFHPVFKPCKFKLFFLLRYFPLHQYRLLRPLVKVGSCMHEGRAIVVVVSSEEEIAYGRPLGHIEPKKIKAKSFSLLLSVRFTSINS